MIVALGTTGAQAQTISLIECRPTLGASIGVTGTGDRAAEKTGGSADAAASFEWPVSDRWSARADFGTAAWTFEDRDAWDVLRSQERVRLDRLAISAINHGPQPCGAPFRVFAGVGAGVYRYRFPSQHAETLTGGLHVMLGADVLTGDSFVIGAEIGIDAINGPKRGPVRSAVLWVTRATIGAKLRF
jgi:hypothetical protein